MNLQEVLENETLPKHKILEEIKKLEDDDKKQILYNQEFLEKKELGLYLKDIILSMGDVAKLEILRDNKFVNDVLHLERFDIAPIIQSLDDDEDKKASLQLYDLGEVYEMSIIKTYSKESKLQVIFEDEHFDSDKKCDLLSSFAINDIIDFFDVNQDFCKKNDIRPYAVVSRLDSESQLEFASLIQEIHISPREKKEVLAILKDDVKQKIDTSKLPEEYQIAISMERQQYSSRIVLDYNRDMEDYRDLDRIIQWIEPEGLTEEQKEKLMTLCDFCPDAQVLCHINGIGYSSCAGDYKRAEEWVNQLVDSLPLEYTQAQKMAVIDNMVGKKLSYSPEFDTEAFDPKRSRNIWEIINSGYGVCNGIARVEQYIFDKVGIESEMISSGSHAFLEIKNIELPLATGDTVKGNTIVDPTWNLTAHKFSGKPNLFCISYEQARAYDIDEEGIDEQCHLNYKLEKENTINLDEKSLRNLFSSVGLADRDGQFPIGDLIDKSSLIDKVCANNPSENINKQFLLLAEKHPEFASCINETTSILTDILLNNENLDFDRCVVNRVYDRADKDKKAVLYVYITSDELGERFYYADKAEGKFIETEQKDLKRDNGVRPGEAEKRQEKKVDFAKSSGRVTEEEMER